MRSCTDLEKLIRSDDSSYDLLGMYHVFAEAMHSLNHAPLRFEARIINDNLHHEAIELSFGQGICTFVFQRILGRNNCKYRGQCVRHSIDADLRFLHRFKQRGLRFGRRTIDLVGQDDVRKKWTGTETKLASLWLEYIDS